MSTMNPRAWFGRLPLRTKLVLSILSVTVAGSIFFYVYIPAQIGEHAAQSLRNRSRVVAAMTAANLSPAMVFDDTLQMNEELLNARLSPDLVYAVVVDANGRLRASWKLAWALAAQYDTARPEGDLLDNKVFRASTPVMHGERNLGTLYLGFSNDPVKQRISEARTRTLIVTLILLLVSVVVIVGVTAVVTRHLQTVVDTAQRVAAGDLHQRVNVRSQDDVRQLGDTINGMLDRLEASQKDLADANRELEDRVELRTHDLALALEEHKRTEASLRLSERRMRQVIDIVPHFIFAKDVTGRFIMVNSTMAEAFGTSVEAMLEKQCEDVYFSAEEAKQFRLDDLEVINCRKPKVIPEETVTLANGRHRIFHTVRIPFTFSGSTVPAILGVAMDITDLKEFQDRLQASLREKDVMLKEIHHRVKNNLQVVSSLLSLQSSMLTDPLLKELLLESQNRIRSMALVHERLYRTGTLATIDFAEYLEYVVTQLLRSYRKPGVQCVVHAEAGTLTVDDAIPCGLIVNELITNCFKHAFPDDQQGEVEVAFRSVDADLYEIMVRDTGVGIPEGQDYTQMASMGMTLINSLVDQLGGIIMLERAGGTVFRLRFPKRV
jgi:PAS domain S-box-containing protein